MRMAGGSPLRAILLPRVTGERDTRLEACSESQALATLAANTMARLPGATQADMQRCAELVAKLPRYYLHLGGDRPQIPGVVARLLARVSVIIPVRDGEKYLGEAIDSVLGQTAPVFEVIVVNNGSSDGSRAVAERCGGVVRVIDQPVPGLARTRNAGVEASRGEILAFLDADDVWDPAKLSRQLAILHTQPDVDMVFTNICRITSAPNSPVRRN